MSEQKKPNILWIMTDQHKFNALSCLWDSLDEAPYRCTERELTPHLDQLAEDGILFTNSYCPSPVCGPARVSLKTGKFPPANGAITNWRAVREDNTYLPQLLKDAGYETGMAGKLHFFPVDRDYGFDHMHLSDAPYSVYWEDDKHSEYIKWLRETSFDKKGIDPVKMFDDDELSYDSDLKRFILGSCFRKTEEHETGWTTDRTLDFLNSWDGKKPFFHFTSYFGPHHPYGVTEPYDTFCKPEDVRLPDSYYHDYMKGAPVFEATCRGKYNHVMGNLNEQDCKELVAAYLGQVRMIDDSIGLIFQRLKEMGIYDDTTIIFCADHGDHLGEHGMFFKGEMYDSCAKVPLIIKPAGSHHLHRRRDQVVNTIDLFRTILDMVHSDWKPTVQQTIDNLESKSLMPLIESDSPVWEDLTYSIYGINKDRCLCMVRGGSWKLIRSAKGPEDAVYELYDLDTDPEENRNRFEDAACAPVLAELKPRLDAWFHKHYQNYIALGV